MTAGVVGLDLSLTATGLATPEAVRVISTKGTTGCGRLFTVREHVLDATANLGPDGLVCIEGYAYGRANGGEFLGELGGVIRLALWERDVTFIDVAPSSLKTYATGKGTASKVQMIVAARERLGYERYDDNEADALWLRALGLDLLGEPLVALPQTHRRALDKVKVS